MMSNACHPAGWHALRFTGQAIRVTSPGGVILFAFLSVFAIMYSNYFSGNWPEGQAMNFTDDHQVRHFKEQLFTGYDITEFEGLFTGKPVEWIKRADINDAGTLAGLAIQMWEDKDPAALTDEFRKLMKRDDAVCFIKYADGIPIAFAQCQFRHDYVEGTESSPVGYLEGIYVRKEYRKNGYAALLLAECEKWAKEKGCTEFASDCELDNSDSLKFHLSLGFEYANRIICFRKGL